MRKHLVHCQTLHFSFTVCRLPGATIYALALVYTMARVPEPLFLARQYDRRCRAGTDAGGDTTTVVMGHD
jgi:hypothetical protein